MNVALIRFSRAGSNHDDPRFTDIALMAFAIVLITALPIAFVSALLISVLRLSAFYVSSDSFGR
jgi:hypothetical protein